jgi:tetratricopeptide (TPR) repeat protein
MVRNDPGKARKLLLVGWGGADWKLITPLLDRGQMPCLNALIERGVMSKLSSPAPLLSPVLWTSAATGKRPDKHGILVAAESDPELGALRPISRTARTAVAVWNILHHQGLKAHVVNWPASHPAEALDGVCVSDDYARVVSAFGDPWPLEPGTVAPERVGPALAELRVHPGDLCGEQLLPFIPRLEEIDQGRDPRVVAVAAVLAETASVHAAATWVLENEAWDFLAVHYGGLEQLGHRFLRYHPPRMAHIPERDFELYRDVVTAGYRFHDLMLARLLRLAGDGATVMLVSDHGFCTGDSRPRGPRRESVKQWHRGQGVFCLAGAGIWRDELLHQVGILDVTPTILTLFDLPVGADMDGRPLLAAWEEPPTPRRIPGWDELIESRPSVPPGPEPPSGEWEEALAELGSLGYLDTLLPSYESLVRTVRRTETYHRALVHRNAGRPDLAAGLLHRLLEEEPENNVVKLYLASCHYLLGQNARCRQVLGTMDETDGDQGLKEKDLLSAMVLIAEDKPQEALDRLQVAQQTHRREPRIFCFIGRAYLRLGRHAEAEEAFGRALAIDEDHVASHLGRALGFAQQHRWDDAADAALTAVGLDHHQCDAHYLLGVALVHMDRPSRAIQAFETALSLRPGWAPARTWLATLRDRGPRAVIDAARLPLFT